MARKSILQRIKNWLTGGGKSTPPKARVSNNRESRKVVSSNTNDRRAYVNAVRGERDDLKREDPWAKTKEAFKATSSKAKPDPKEQLRQKARSEREKERRDYYKATNDRYNVKGAKDKAEELKRRQAVKSRAFDSKTAVKETEHAMKYHKGAESFARGAVSGATFGASDVLAKFGTKGEAKKAENVYQKKKSKGAEMAGEVAGSLASFGLTSGASKAVVKKALPRTTKFASKQGAKAAEKLATTKLVRKAAEKEVKNAVKKGIEKEVTKEAVERVAKQKAKEVVTNLGEDAAINLTADKIYSATQAAKDTKELKDLKDLKNPDVLKKLGKNFAKNELANVLLSSTATVGLPAAGKGIKRALGGVSEGAEEALKGLARERELRRAITRRAGAPNLEAPRISIKAKAEEPKVKVDLGRKRMTDVRLPNERPLISEAANAPTKVEPPRNVAPSQATAETPTPIRNQELHDLLNDEIVPYSTKVEAHDRRVDEISRELDSLDERIGAGDAEAQNRASELADELRQIDDDYKVAREQAGETASPVENAIDNDRAITPSTRSVNDEIRSSLNAEDREAFTRGTEREAFTPEEAEELKGENWRTREEHTRQGATTIAAGMGDREYKPAVEKMLDDGELTIEVYHDKENYAKGAQRVLDYADGKGGKTGKQNLESLVERFTRYADGDEPITSREARDMLYDVLASVDYANTLAKDEATKDLGERLFLSATKAGAELTSVSGLSLRQWQKIAMSSPEYRTKAVKQQIEIMFNQSRGFRKKFGKLEGGMKKLRDGTAKNDGSALDDFIKAHPNECKDLQEELDVLMNAKTKEEVEDAASHVIMEARKVMPVTAFDQLTQWRYVAMLSSPTTHVKNIVGNIYSGTLGQLNSAISGGIQNHLMRSGKVNANEYLKSGYRPSVAARNDATVGVFEGIKLDNLKGKLKDAERALSKANDASRDVAQKRVDDLMAQVEAAQKTFDGKKPKSVTGAKAQELYHGMSKEHLIKDAEKWVMSGAGVSGKALGKASDLVGKALETSDAVAVERIYRETADKVLRANDYERLLKLAEGTGDEAKAAKAQVKRLEEYAAQHAAYKAALDTYRNYNAVANWMNKTIKNTLYNADAAWYKKAGGFVLHAVMPFTKVPTNILKRSVDYSPFGLIEGKKMLNAAIESGDYAEINKAVERFSEGLIGTGIASLGMAMGALDPDGMTITTRLNRSSELDKQKKDRGYMDYSVRAGNKDFTLEWATPTASTFFVGVEAGRMLRNACEKFASESGLEFNLGEALTTFEEVLSTMIEPTMQLTMFQGVNSILEDSMTTKYSSANVHPVIKMIGNIPNNYINSMSPAILNRLSRAFAPYDYFISGATQYEYRKNLALSKVPILSRQKLDARANNWGQVRNERTTTGEKVLNAAVSLASPMNVSNVTWDETDDKLYDLTKEGLEWDIFPKTFYGNFDDEKGSFTNDISFGRNRDNTIDVELSNNDKAQYNLARGKSGEDAMSAALESVMFNRRTKDEKGHSIPRDDAYTPAQKSKLIAEYKGKGAKDVVKWVMEQPEFKNATPKEKEHVLKEIVGNGNSEDSRGAKRTSELAVVKRHNVSEDEYDYKNEITEKKQKELDPLIEAGVLTYRQVVNFAHGAAKVGYYENESGGYSSSTYNQEYIMNYLEASDLSDDAKKALYDAYYEGKQTYEQALAKHGKGKGGYRRRRGGYRRYSSGGSKAKVPTTKVSDFKASKATYKDMASSLPKRRKSVSESPVVKVEPPKVKFKKYEV